MKKIALVIITVLASLNLLAQEAGTFVVTHDGQHLLFNASDVDSITFNNPQNTNVIPVRQLTGLPYELTSIKEDIHLLRLDLEQFRSLIAWFDDNRKMLNDTVLLVRQQLAATNEQIDSLHTLTSSRLDTLKIYADRLNDSLYVIIDKRMLRADSISNQRINRLDTITHTTYQAVNRLLQLANDTLRQRLAQAVEVQQQQQQTISQLTATLEQLQSQIDETQHRMEVAQDYVDVNTGQTYRMALIDGELKPIPAYHNILIIGNSFSTHDPIEDLWWSNHSMAASTADVTWVEYLKQVTATQVDVLPAWSFEWNYQKPDFNFKEHLPISRDYEVVIVQIQENAWPNPLYDYKAAWERLYTYLKEQCPRALFLQCIGWYNEQRYSGIVHAAKTFNIPVVDNRKACGTGNFRVGDYVWGNADEQYHPINNQSVADHPSDVGFLLMANNVLRQLGLPTVEKRLHQLNITKAKGGILSVAYPQWPEKGLVSLRIEPDINRKLKSINVVTLSGQTVDVVCHANSLYDGTEHAYCTFIMPSDDVTITPTWE